MSNGNEHATWCIRVTWRKTNKHKLIFKGTFLQCLERLKIDCVASRIDFDKYTLTKDGEPI